ncbi:MAG: hypothetical protein IPM84_14900 [Anaerolineae bacterium]|nr:hypothetical protein [Anaerolineae bacterium]
MGKPLDTETSFPAGITAFYAFSDFTGMQNGLKCANRLYLNGVKLMDNAYVWGDEWLPWAGESEPGRTCSAPAVTKCPTASTR